MVQTQVNQFGKSYNIKEIKQCQQFHLCMAIFNGFIILCQPIREKQREIFQPHTQHCTFRLQMRVVITR